MENDSLNAENVLDSTSGVVDADSAGAASGIEMPTAEELGISVVAGTAGDNGAPQSVNVTVGDTFEFPVTVSWSVSGSALLVVPVSSANAKGVTQLGVSQESSRSVKDGKEIANITFTYKLVAEDTGSLNIPAMRFEIPTQVGTPIELRSESVPLRVEAPFNPLPLIVGGVVALCLVVAGLWRMRRRAALRVKEAARKASADALRAKMLVLKQRVNTADSREWLLELESICKEEAPEKFVAVNGSASAGVSRAEIANGAAADGITANGTANGNVADSTDGWDALLKEFAHARYGGGKRDAFELREIWKAAVKLLRVEEE